MRATLIGHAGVLIETEAGSILCDPWFVPAFFGSWFVSPRNDQLGNDLSRRIEVGRRDPPTGIDPPVELDGYVQPDGCLVQRRCRHRTADLGVFGEIERGRADHPGNVLVCTLHGRVLDCETGERLTSNGHPGGITRA